MMERLTTRDIDGTPILLHDKGYAALLDRLAAYEDTELEPEEIKRLWMRRAADAIEELQAQINGWIELERKALIKSVPKWINVKERLPEENGRYLVVLKRCGFVNDIKLNDEEIKILRYHDGWRLPYHIPEWINETLKQEVTHWMPLPEPPEVKK